MIIVSQDKDVIINFDNVESIEVGNIEEVVERLEKSINDVWFSTTYSQEDEERDLRVILSDYKRVLKENEELKQMLDERFIYVTGARTVYARLMQLDKEIIVKDDLKRRNEIKQLLKENEELKDRWDKDTHKLQNDLDIANAEIIELKSDNYELNNRINDLLDSISKQKIKDKIEELNKKEKQELKGTKGQDRYSIKQQYMYQINILQDLLEEKGE